MVKVTFFPRLSKGQYERKTIARIAEAGTESVNSKRPKAFVGRDIEFGCERHVATHLQTISTYSYRIGKGPEAVRVRVINYAFP